MNNSKNLIKISDVVENQIPEFILSENPNFSEFLKQYYISQQFQSAPVDLAENIAYYKNADAFDSANLIAETTLSSDIDFSDDIILVSSTKGWPEKYGLLKIDNEVITYTGITTNSFTGCVRGFSGITSLETENDPEFLVFSATESNFHESGTKVQNLSNLFLQKFFEKIKYQFIPGFETVDFHPSVNPQNFISKARSFYQTKGTNQCYDILFKLLYNEEVEILKPKDRCFTTSDDQWVVTETFVCEVIQGNPYNIKGETLYQEIDVNNQVLPATGSIYEVESFLLENKLLFKIKIFAGYSNNLNPNGSILGKFLPTPRTNIVEDIVGAKNVIFVDSTVGFPKAGTIEINGVDYTYTDKTNNEFLNVTGLNSSSYITKSTEVVAKNYVFAYENGDSSKVVKLRLFNILSKIKSEDVLYALDQDPIKVSSIGIKEKTPFNSSLVYNLPLTINSGIATTFITPTIRNYFKRGFSLTNGLAVTKTNHNLRPNDTVNLFTKLDNLSIRSNLNVNTSLSKEFTVESIPNTSILGKEVIFRRNIKKSKAVPFSRFFNDINDKYTANIQDCYSDNNYNYLTSNGLPDYQINPYERRSAFTVTDTYKLTGEHNFYNGEEVVVSTYSVSGVYENPLGIKTGNSYYIKRNNSGEIQISESRENVGLSSFISFIEKNQFGFETGRLNTIEFVASSVYGNILTSSRLLKKFPKKPIFSEKKVETEPGSIGIFVNGVEIQNYKSFDKIYYGPIENVVVLNGGSDYSLISPPKLKIYGISNKVEIVDNQTVLIPSMKGTLKSLIIKNPGFDYQETPIVTISGGNNEEVITEVKMKDINKEVVFNATTKDSVVNTVDNELRFGFPHGFVTGDAVVYETFGTKPIGIGTIVADGTLLNNEVYYAVNIGAGTSIKLASSKQEALSQTNLLKFRTTGGGIQAFKSLEGVQVIDRVSILSKNLNFEYKKRSFGYEDINPYNNTFFCTDHGFKTGESVLISSLGAPLDGPSLDTTYYIVKIDDDTFKLSTSKDTINYVEINSVDPASTYFIEYEPIKVNVIGSIKKNQSSLPGYGATIIPVVEGYVEDVRVQRGLAQPPEQFFGISSVLNYNNAPIVTLYEGYDASFYPLIVNGRINQVVVKSSGFEYYNNIELKVNGSGYGAKLIPVVSNGQIIDVTIVSPGVGYASTNTTIEVVPIGQNLKLKAELKSWTINEVTKLGINNLSSGNLFGKRYSIFGNTYGTFFLDLNQRNSFNIPDTPDKHSPIVGWAYDGCPIYGPFAYANPDGSGDVVRMRSGYSRNKISPFILDCIEDYVFTGTGTLDEYNGRYCVTPEYPNGTYAYFCTLNESNSPEYPYVIGGKYNYTPQKENFDLRFNQTIDINSLNIIKNTSAYRLDDTDDSYEYFKLYSSSIPDAKVISSSVGKVSKIDVINGGENYEVGDKITFNSDFTEGFGAYGEVSEVGGVGVSSIFKTTTNIENITLTTTKGGILGITTTEHNLVNDDFITISGISTTDYEFLESYYKIQVEDQLVTGLSTNLSAAAVTGQSTYIKVKESLFKFEIDDKLNIENETMTIIGLDYVNNSIRVLREVGSPGYGIGSTVFLQNTKFKIPYSQKNLVLPEKKISYYFDPSTQVPIGVTTSIGAGATVYDYFAGYGKSTTKFVSNGELYLPNHKFKTGDRLKYSYPNTSSSIVTNSGNLDSIPDLYAVKINDDTLGIVENKLFLKNKDNLLLYTSVGTGNVHKLETDNSVVTCQLNRNIVTITTGDEVGIGSTFVQIAHNLNVGDKIKLNVKSNEETTYVVGYSSVTKRLTINGQINPELNFIENEIIIFDITSPDLAGCEFNLYTDKNFENIYYGNDVTGLEVTRSINDVSLTITDSTPRILYYNLSSREKEIYPDIEVKNYNQILIIPSKYNVSTDVIDKTDYTFNISLQDIPEIDSYTSELSEITYSVSSKGVKGPISKAKVLFGGVNYKKLPKIDGVVSTSGIGANLIASSNSIGKIKATRILNNTSIFPTDKTLTPVSYLYSVVTAYNNFSVDTIEIDYPGSNYISPPDLILYNRKENLIIDNFDALAKLKNSFIESIDILNPGTGLKSSDSEIICLNNTNGFKVLNAIVSGTTPFTVDVTLETPLAGFSTSNDLPIEVGDKIFVENIVSTLGNGFNSSDHKYQTFEVIFVDKAYSSQDAALVRYEIPSYPGVFDAEETYNGTIVNAKNIPILTPILKENAFTNSEKINGTEILDNENNEPITSLLKVYDSSGLSVGQVITGESSNSKGKIYTITDYPKSATTTISVDSSVNESVGWKNFRGNLSSILQKLPDNDYYQNFSYSLKSKKSYTEWNSIVSDLSHVSGYKKFSDMIIESTTSAPVGINSDTSSVVNVVITSESDVNTVVNFDLVSEEDLDDNEGEYSEYLKFASKVLSNYLLSIENKVLPIDDISTLFDTDNSPVVNIVVDTVNNNESTVLKYYFFIASTTSFFGDFVVPQILELLVTRLEDNIFLTSYGWYWDNTGSGGKSKLPLGEITASFGPTNNDEIVISFTPRNIFNSYSVRAVKEVTNNLVGIASTSFGFIDSIEQTSSFTSVQADAGSPQTLLSVPKTDCTSGVVFFGIADAPKQVKNALEFSFIKNGTNIEINQYTEFEPVDLGDLEVQDNGANIDFVFTGVGVAVTVFTNYTLFTESVVSPTEVVRDLSRLGTVEKSHSGTSPVGISTISSVYGATKYIVEMVKSFDDGIGIVTQRSLIQINTVHFEQYSNNVEFGIVGNIPTDELIFTTEYDSFNQEYTLTFDPIVDAVYDFKIYEKSIVSPNQVL